jgi:hypothetical protein
MRAETPPLKLTWTLMTIASTLACFFIIANTTSDFLKYDVFTQTKRIQDNSATLPSVIFCSTTTANLTPLFHTVFFQAHNAPNHHLTGEVFFPNEKYGNSCLIFNHYRSKGEPRTLLTVRTPQYDRLVFLINENFTILEGEVYLNSNN